MRWEGSGEEGERPLAARFGREVRGDGIGVGDGGDVGDEGSEIWIERGEGGC